MAFPLFNSLAVWIHVLLPLEKRTKQGLMEFDVFVTSVTFLDDPGEGSKARLLLTLSLCLSSRLPRQPERHCLLQLLRSTTESSGNIGTLDNLLQKQKQKNLEFNSGKTEQSVI